MWTKKFWVSAIERDVKTAAQTTAGMITGNAVGIMDVNWKVIGGVAAMSTVYSILTSIASAPIGPQDDPSTV